jgi:hypothetical protein
MRVPDQVRLGYTCRSADTNNSARSEERWKQAQDGGKVQEHNKKKGKRLTITLIIFPEDGKRYSFQNAVFFRSIRQWTKSKNLILPSAICRHQNPLK